MSSMSTLRLSRDLRPRREQNVSMSETSGTDYKTDFLHRTKHAREKAGFTQEEIARVLQIPQDTYKQYEIRSLLPHRYIGAFCAATRISETWLITGHGPARPNTQRTPAQAG